MTSLQSPLADHSATPTPRRQLPVEVLEDIFSLAFEQDISPTSLQPTPTASVLGLLLVSSSIRAFVLPFFWRSITICRPLDWIALFEAEDDRGLLVGETDVKRQRRGWIQELAVLVPSGSPESQVPVDMVKSSQELLDLMARHGKNVIRRLEDLSLLPVTGLLPGQGVEGVGCSARWERGRLAPVVEAGASCGERREGARGARVEKGRSDTSLGKPGQLRSREGVSL